MSFLKKIFKGVGKVFRKIGRGIKKGFKKFGKFMGKLGIVGQLAMMFILPGIGGALMKGFGAMAGNMSALTGAFQGMSGAMGAIVKGAGTVLKAAHGFVQTGVNAFKTVTSGLMEFGKTALNKIPGINIEGASANFFGKDSVMEGITMDAKNIMNPFKDNITLGKNTGSLEDFSKSVGLSPEELSKLNPDIRISETNFKSLVESNQSINLDYSKIAPDMDTILSQAADTTSSVTDFIDDPFGTKIDTTQVNNLNFKPTGEQLDFGTDFTKPVDFSATKPFEISNLKAESRFTGRIGIDGLPEIQEGMFAKDPFAQPDFTSSSFTPDTTYNTALGDASKVLGDTTTAGITTPEPSLLSRLGTNVKNELTGKFTSALDKPLTQGLPMVQSIMSAVTPEEVQQGPSRPGYVADVLPMYDFRAVDATQILNAGNYGAGAVSMDFLNYGNVYNQRMAFPGALGGR